MAGHHPQAELSGVLRLPRTESTEEKTDVLPSDRAMHAGCEERRGLAQYDGGACGRQELRCRRADDRPSCARHEALHLPGPKRVRLSQGGRSLALRTATAQA